VADEYTLFRNHLCRLDLPECPELLLEATIQVVIASAAYASIDGVSFAAFLRMQRYDPAEAVGAQYALTFDLFGKAFARVLVGKGFVIPDLADLCGFRWHDYEVAGYSSLLISRTDRKPLTRRELAWLEKHVTNDLRYDYLEDELHICFDAQYVEGALLVSVQELGPYNDEEQRERGSVTREPSGALTVADTGKSGR
jgi:hypothetical protein